MSKQAQSKPALNNAGGKEGGYSNGVPGKFVDRDLRAVNPKSEQFEPTTAEPVRAKYKMAGGC